MKTWPFRMSAILSLLVVFGAPAFNTPAYSSGSSCAQLLDQAIPVFNQAFFDLRIYRIADCQANVLRLLQSLKAQQTDLKDAQVLYIFRATASLDDLDRSSLIWLHPKSAKLGIGPFAPPWMFHVNLLVGTKILDLDFGHWPSPIDAEEYFRRMFPQQAEIYVRSVPAEEYLADYLIGIEDHDWRKYLFHGEPRYPARRLPDFLSSQEGACREAMRF